MSFTSDFLTYTQPGTSFVLGLGTVTTGLALGPDNFLQTFTADIQGQFSANFAVIPAAAVPAPTSLVMFGIRGIAAGVLSISIRRKRMTLAS